MPSFIRLKYGSSAGNCPGIRKVSLNIAPAGIRASSKPCNASGKIKTEVNAIPAFFSRCSRGDIVTTAGREAAAANPNSSMPILQSTASACG
jgi:hypothetical protein